MAPINENDEGESETGATYEEITNDEKAANDNPVPYEEVAPINESDEGVTEEEKSLLKLMFNDFWKN